MKQGRRDEALAIYRWFRPLLDLDVSTYLVQNIKLAEVLAIGTNDRVRMPRLPLVGERRAAVEKIVQRRDRRRGRRCRSSDRPRLLTRMTPAASCHQRGAAGTMT